MPRFPAVAALTFALALALPAHAQTAAPPAAAPAAMTQAPPSSETARLNVWLDAQYETSLQFSPIGLTFLGRKDLYDRLDDVSDAAVQKQIDWQRASVAEMETTFDRDALDLEGRLSYDLWAQQAREAAEQFEFRRNGYAFTQMMGPQAMLPTLLINFHKVDTEADYLAYVARLRALPTMFDTLLEHTQASAQAGIRAPKFAYTGVITQSRNVITGAPFTDGDDTALWADLVKKADALREAGTVDAARADALKAQAREALLTSVGPAYQRVIAWHEGDIGNALENPAGVGTTQKNGAAYYAMQLRRNTSTDLSAEQIHDIGLKDVARLHADMEAIKTAVGFDGDLKAFFRFIATDPQFKFPDTDAGRQAYLDESTRLLDNIKRQLPQFYGLMPKADLVVRRVESFREEPGAAQHYFPSSPDGTRPGIYYAHLSDMNAMPKPELEVIAYHEGLPGHHMQIAIAQELTGMPQFRTQAQVTAYAEGWGLYSEWQAKEIPGTYADPYSRYGQLSSELWRAIRLVVDTGMHAKGWTEQQAVDYFNANSGFPEATVRSEVQRYLSWPGQATAYKIGMIRIQELRAEAEQALGDRFDVRGFHDAVLGGGALPLDLLEQRVDAWVESASAAR
ncbi:DUF885 domain-containing protein [Luteimonas terrae]|uniref:DUF885 domain-containing protein n=1 Tax=Luteimonas terrae TaxID=1530191 RepID=A0A4R5UD63_9GAMM|nr:DUF885 domain-containing protein [Luteimonas terrae]TDK33163.1 DUF885 domain-containing protein [Luteimonas terrae]